MKSCEVALPSSVRLAAAAFLAGLVLCSCGAGKRTASSLSDSDRLALDDYEQIRAALAADDATAARSAATKMVADLTPADPKAPAPPLLGPAAGVADATALDTQRQRFEILSNRIVPMATGLDGYYVMRSDLPNTVPWVQRSKDVDNPFFGKAMHSLGELRK